MTKAQHNFRSRIIILLACGTLIIMLGLVRGILSNNVLGFSAWFAGALITAVFITLSAWLSVCIRPDDHHTRSGKQHP